MSVIERAQHWTDETAGAARLRTISNWVNYRTPAGPWAPTDDTAEDDAPEPPDWQGVWDFRARRLNAPMQSFLVGRLDSINSTLVGLRMSSRPECWVNFRAVGVNDYVVPEVSLAERSAVWRDLWGAGGGVDLRWSADRHKLSKLITIRRADCPTVYRFTLRLAPGMTFAVSNNVARFFDGQGVEIFRTRPPHAFDSLGNSLRCSVAQGADVTLPGGAVLPTLRVSVNASDMAASFADGATRVELDPTVTISGTASIEDNKLFSISADNNFGSNGYISASLTTPYRGLFRVTGAFPAGAISAFVWKYYTASNNTRFTAYRITAANTWVEGNSNNAIEAGASCWNFAKYNTQSWAGSVGCNTSGIDFEATGYVGPLVGSAGQWGAFSLPTQWAVDWRDGSWVNNGFRLTGAATQDDINSTENAANKPYFEVTYSTVTAAFFQRLLRRVRS